VSFTEGFGTAFKTRTIGDGLNDDLHTGATVVATQDVPGNFYNTETGEVLRTLAEETSAYVRQKLPKIYTRELVDVIFEQPYCRIANLVDAGIVRRQAASRYLKALVAIGVLEERAFGREKLFVNPKLLNLLTREGNVDSR
jgi:hypothetical protein